MTGMEAAWSFSGEDQERFATLSGDWNPIHMDAVFARRTMAGSRVVHGIHLLMHALEQAAAAGLAAQPPLWLEASFTRFVLVGEVVTVRQKAAPAGRLRLELMVDGGVRSDVLLGFEAPGVPAIPQLAAGELVDSGRRAQTPDGEAVSGFAGAIAAAAPVSEWERSFPNAARWIGGERLAALGASTRLVGMVCPGLHSVYMGLKVRLTAPGGDPLAFAVGAPRHGLIRTEIAGGGLGGSLTCLMRAAPHRQPRFADLAGLVPADAFAGAHAFVIGGSRGLGEVAAKLLAAGGAHVTLTYARGADEARAVAAEIGPSATVLRYDVAGDAAAQIATLEPPPSHVYYFATPRIAQPTSRFLDMARLDELMTFFTRGFWKLAEAVRARRADACLFYPSTVYVDERPKGMAEYAMAKAAGEVMCAEIARLLAPLRVVTVRLPQLATDQTLTNHGASGGEAAATLLPIIRAVQGARTIES